MKIQLVVVALIIGLFLLLIPFNIKEETREISVPQPPQLDILVRDYLKSKKSPLAEEVDFLLQQKHWKLLIAISHIESQFCKIKIAYNCWGVGGDSAYRRYSSYKEAIKDANDLIERWQLRGRWLTIDDMNCHYVVPCNPNWVNVVNLTLKDLDALIATSNGTTL